MSAVSKGIRLFLCVLAWGSMAALVWGCLIGYFPDAEWWELLLAFLFFLAMAAITSEF